MTADKSPKLPPARVAHVVDAIRRRLRRAEQKMVPPPAAVLDLMTGAWVARPVRADADGGHAPRRCPHIGTRHRVVLRAPLPLGALGTSALFGADGLAEHRCVGR